MKTKIAVSAAVASLLFASCSKDTPRPVNVDIALSAAELTDLQLIETAYGRTLAVEPKALADDVAQRPLPVLASMELPMTVEKAASFGDRIAWNGTKFVPKGGIPPVNQVFGALTPDEVRTLNALDKLVDKAQEFAAKDFAAKHPAKPMRRLIRPVIPSADSNLSASK